MGTEILRRTFLGSALRIVSTGVLSLGALTGGAFATGVIGIPSLERVDNEFGEVTDEQTEIVTHLTVTNPNPFDVRSAEVSAAYTVEMNGVEMAEGRGDSFALESGTSTETVTTWMTNARIPDWWVTHVQNGEVTEVVVDATVSSGALDRSTNVSNSQTIETDLISSFDSDERRPIDANSPLISDPVLYVERTRANWGGVDDQHTELGLRFDMFNPQNFDIPVTRLGYEISMNDIVVGDGETTREHLLRSGQVTAVETATRIRNRHLDDWWVTHLRNGEVTDLRIEFDARVQVLGTSVSLPLDALTYEETIETDIWGNEEDEESDGDTADGGNESSDADGEGDEDEEETETDTGSDSSSDGESDDQAASDDGSETTDADENDDEDTDDGGLLSGLPLSNAP